MASSTSTTGPAGGPDSDSSPRFTIKGQYVKDLSFENPHSPHSLIAVDAKPQIDISIDLKAQRFDDNFFEVVLRTEAHAKGKNAEGKDISLFLAQLDYAAIIQLVNVPDDKIEPILMVDCAFVLFPFARRVMSDITRDGGFPPLMLEPIDFHRLYLSNKETAKAS